MAKQDNKKLMKKMLNEIHDYDQRHTLAKRVKGSMKVISQKLSMKNLKQKNRIEATLAMTKQKFNSRMSNTQGQSTIKTSFHGSKSPKRDTIEKDSSPRKVVLSLEELGINS